MQWELSTPRSCWAKAGCFQLGQSESPPMHVVILLDDCAKKFSKCRTRGSLCSLQRRAVGSNTGHCAWRQRVGDHRLGRKRACKHGHSLQLLLKLSWMCWHRIALCYWDSLLRLLGFCYRQASDLTARAKILCLELKKPTSAFGYSEPC